MKNVSIPRSEYALLLAVMLATILPFWAVLVPAATDLPQHLNQLYLLQHTLAGEHPDLMVTPWYYPNTLIYWLLYGVWLVVDPVITGKIAMSALAVAWVMSSWWLMRLCRRPFVNWLISVPIAFNFLFSWGLLNFLIGWPVFCVFLTAARQPPSRHRGVCLLLAALLLYYAHALWFAMANVWLAVLMLERSNKERWALGWPMLPVWVMALVWYPQLAADRQEIGFNTGVQWLTMPHERLDPGYLVNSMLGSIQGKIEGDICLLIGVWIAAALLSNRKRLTEMIDKPLLVAGLIMFMAFWIFPDVYMNTIFFHRRWLPCGMALVLLALPAPRLPLLLSRYIALAGVGLIITLSLITVQQLRQWQDEALDGFLGAIALLHKGEYVLGMNLYDGSAYVKGRPGVQLFAYAQCIRGVDLRFDFTDHASGVVQFRKLPVLKRYPFYSSFLLTPAQVKDFDRLLVNGDETMHVYARKRWHLVQIDDAKTNWRVYRNAP